jgi:general secretion pathway protein A
MDYYELLHLKREPFSNSPDPAFFYASPGYLECLQKLEIAIRLRRGLNLVLGEVGAGKTTMSRVLLQNFEKERERFQVHLILDPGFSSDREMLVYLLRLFGIQSESQSTITDLKDQFQHVLLEQGLQENKVVVLLIDEGQKLSPSGLEIIRELLNFETNENKLLQVVIFAQMELRDRLRKMTNLTDRINAVFRLQPLSLHETRAMVQHRLIQAGMTPDRIVFTEDAIRKIYRFTRGHPRRIITLCHHTMLRALIEQSEQVTGSIVVTTHKQRQSVQKISKRKHLRLRLRWAAALIVMAVCAVVLYEQRESWMRTDSPDAGTPSSREASVTPKVEVAHSAPKIQEQITELDSSSPNSSSEPPADSPIEMGEAVDDDSFHNSSSELPADPDAEMVQPASVEELAPKSWSSEAWFRLHPLEIDNAASGKKIVVRKGDTLSGIVKMHYGTSIDSSLIQALKDANDELTDPNLLVPGQTLILPALGEGLQGFYSKSMAWFQDEESAENWAATIADGEDAVFVVCKELEGSLSYGVFMGMLRNSQEGGQGLVRIDEDTVLRVYGEPQETWEEEGL